MRVAGPVIAVGLAWWTLASAGAGGGPFAPAPDQAESTAVSASDDRIVAWATGWTNYVHGSELWDFFDPDVALGPATSNHVDVVSLGNGGALALTFEQPIVNGPGPDFAVFGNSLWPTQFLELAYVEVSSDGAHYVRFENTSLTPTNVPFIHAFMDPTLINGLAGKYPVGFGVPFDLDELEPVAELDVNSIRFVRLVDSVGDGTATDSVGNIIYDPHPTQGSAGFDLEALGVLNQQGPLHDWRVAHFDEEAGSARAADEASWSGDAIPNRIKYAMGLDPLEEHTGAAFTMGITHTNGATHVWAHYQRRADRPDVRLVIQRSHRLEQGAWSGGPDVFEETVVEEVGDVQTIRALSVEPGIGTEFLRMQGVPTP